MTIPDIRRMNVRAFWALFENIERIQADQDLRLIAAIGTAISGSKENIRALQSEKGEVAAVEEEFDRAAFDGMKAALMAGR